MGLGYMCRICAATSPTLASAAEKMGEIREAPNRTSDRPVQYKPPGVTGGVAINRCGRCGRQLPNSKPHVWSTLVVPRIGLGHDRSEQPDASVNVHTTGGIRLIGRSPVTRNILSLHILSTLS